MAIRLETIPVEHAVDLHRLRAHPSIAAALGTPASRERWREYLRELDTAHVKLIGAYDEDVLLGAAELTIQSRVRQRHVGRLWLMVDPSCAGQGIGQTLLRAIVDAADSWWNLIRLEVDVPTDQRRAIEFFRKAGFELEATRRSEIRTDSGFADVAHLARIRAGVIRPSETRLAPKIPHRVPLEPDSELYVRSIRESDAPALHALHETDSVMEGTLFTPFQTERDWRRRLNPRDGTPTALVALLGEQLVGTLTLFEHESTRSRHAYGLGLAVAPASQGRGVGDALLSSALELADGWLGATRVFLEVYVDNHRAIALYRKHGFEHEGTARWSAFRRGSYIDAHLMGRVRPDAPRAL